MADVFESDNKENMSNNPQAGYFAAKDAKMCANILLNKSNSFFNILQSNAYLEKLVHMWRAYHGAYGTYAGYGHQVEFTGEQGELVSLPTNHFRNIAQHIYTMLTANRPVMEARAINTDYKSLAQTYLANGILDYYMREKKLEDYVKKAAELAVVLGAGYVKIEWNATAGEIYDADEDSGELQYEGELEFSNLTPFDVIFDGTKESWSHDWIMTRTFKNRYDLMAKYPELSNRIKGLPSKSDSQVYRLAIWSNDDTDDVPVYEFFHKRTEALPDGRYMLFLSDDVVLLDIDLPYRVVPIFRIAAGEILGTPYAYSPMFDIFPIQEGINTMMSAIMTNQNAFAVQNVWVPRGADINFSSIGGAMNILEGAQKPEPINLGQTDPNTFKFLETLIQTAETLSGVNSVARGNPEASLKSGTALALVQSMSLQFISGLQQSYVKLIEDVGTALIQILKDYANTPKTVALIGKNNRPLLKEFTGDKISAINRVVVDLGNPLSKTIAGRVQMAEQMLQMKLITDPEEYFQVINTGRLDTMFQGETAELLYIASENEQMLEGKDPLVAPTDQHSLHINEHKSVLADPDLRNDPTLVKKVMDHIQGHLDALRNTDPGLLQMTGQQPLPPLPGSQMAQPPQPQQPPQASLGGPMPQVMSQPPTNISAGQQIQGPGVQNVGLPGLPHPPGQFKNLPVTAQQLVPPVHK